MPSELTKEDAKEIIKLADERCNNIVHTALQSQFWSDDQRKDELDKGIKLILAFIEKVQSLVKE